ncbi:hypothetical protein JTE90_025500 [Oedothorax gibbosus]|uniref:Uncharacterized protein n=1 Tax=Oedothorax gibbosus TaxID=931172 RepID=A0AAV6UZG5_9ARAC|nr:hypothetical protein JTE90_025500 [Oedothorax gibbosus]KAG8189069.1 hypothetical protein JTE90_025500 [Oedothorax gibbosus]
MMIGQQEVPLNGNKVEENSHVHVETDSKGFRNFVWWNRRSRFERKLILLCLLFFVVCTALVIVNVISQDRLRRAERITSGTCHSKECIQAASQILEKMNPMVEPCDNFYEFACGNYINRNTVPDDHYTKSTMQTMEEDVYVTIKKMMERPVTSNDSEAIIKVKNLYTTCMNTSIVEDYSVTNLRELLTDQGIGEWPMIQTQWKKDKVDLEWRLAMLHVHQVQPLISTFVAPDDRNSSVKVLLVYSGSPLFSTDASDPNYARLYMSYKNLIAETVRLLKAPESTVKSDIEDMLDFEYKLTNISQGESSTENDTSSMDEDQLNKFNISMLEERIPEIKWGKLFGYFFDSIGLSALKDDLIIEIHCEKYLKDMVLLINRTSPRTVANYLTWRFVAKYLPYLDIHFRRLFNDFSQLLPDSFDDKRIFFARWKECVNIIKDKFGMALAALYVKEESYREDNLEEVKTLTSTLKHSFAEGIQEQSWLDTETKSVCEEKVLEMKLKLGFPSYILDPVELDTLYSGLDISEDNFLDNILKMNRYDVTKEMSETAGTVAKDSDWLGMSPLLVNAFYKAFANTIVLPLGILRPPFFVPGRLKYLNYGMIGFIIAHEITHGFDNSQVERNKQFKDGNVTQWWPDDMVEKFREQADCFVDQYFQLPIDIIGLNVSGNRTLGDNICDNSGMKVAYRYGEEPSLPGFSYNNLQVFFLQYAQTFCEVLSKEGYEKYTKDSHSPGKYRSNIPLMNSPEFSSVFNCPVGSPMNPAKKCRLWG